MQAIVHSYVTRFVCKRRLNYSKILMMHSNFFHIQPDPNAKPNLNPIQTAPPKFIKSVANGKLYTVGDGDDMISVVHVWGE